METKQKIFVNSVGQSDIFDFTGKTIIITGASKGLGSVCAQALAERNATLVLMARSADKLAAVQASCKNAESHLAIAGDLTDPKILQDALRQVKEFQDTIDVVLHVAGGGLGLRDPLLSSEDLLKLFFLNIAVAVEINKHIAPQMMARGTGRLVHVCSIASSEATGSVGYNTVKAALAAYVRSLGREIAHSGVVATGILPGGFLAPENSFVRLRERNPEAYKDFIETRLPRKALGTAEELIPFILLLCSEAASMMGGCLIPIDAGEGKGFLAV